MRSLLDIVAIGAMKRGRSPKITIEIQIARERVQPKFGREERPQGADYIADHLKDRVQLRVSLRDRGREVKGEEVLTLTRWVRIWYFYTLKAEETTYQRRLCLSTKRVLHAIQPVLLGTASKAVVLGSHWGT